MKNSKALLIFGLLAFPLFNGINASSPSNHIDRTYAKYSKDLI